MSKTKENPVTTEELIDIALVMAQELREFIDDADCDNPLLGTQALLNEWETLFQRTDYSWQKNIQTQDEESQLLSFFNDEEKD